MKANKLTAGHNLMWESSRMMLPEHVERILDWKQEDERHPQPIIDEQQWEEYNQIIQEALIAQQKVAVTVWENGVFVDIEGWIHNVDAQLRRIRLDLDEFDVEYVDIKMIAAVKMAE